VHEFVFDAVTVENVPAGQTLQAVSPSKSAYVPGAQSMQAVEARFAFA
jgi:hypothetical protein